MSTDRIEKTESPDILTIMRELEARAIENRTDKTTTKPTDSKAQTKDIDPVQLRDSLQKKRAFLELVNGIPELKVKGIDELQQEINEKIGFLEQVIANNKDNS